MESSNRQNGNNAIAISKKINAQLQQAMAITYSLNLNFSRDKTKVSNDLIQDVLWSIETYLEEAQLLNNQLRHLVVSANHASTKVAA